MKKQFSPDLPIVNEIKQDTSNLNLINKVEANKVEIINEEISQ